MKRPIGWAWNGRHTKEMSSTEKVAKYESVSKQAVYNIIGQESGRPRGWTKRATDEGRKTFIRRRAVAYILTKRRIDSC